MSKSGSRRLRELVERVVQGWTGLIARATGAPGRVPPTGGAPPQRRSDPAQVWTDRLVERGIEPDRAARIAPRLADEHRELGRGSSMGLLSGAAIASEVHREERLAVERHLRDVREVERLLGAFSGELEKLDEVLEVLSAYAKRMRTQPPPTARTSRRLLH